MNWNFKLFFKYILFYSNQLFFKYNYRNDKNTNIITNQIYLYYLSLHFKLSSLFYSTQLVDMLAYDAPSTTNKPSTNSFYITAAPNLVLIYNFHSILFQQRFFIFILNKSKFNFNKNFLNWIGLNSITELFLNSNWLEREISELNNVFFCGKKDLRNLMLQYGDTSAPMQKSFPSIGIREIFYDSNSDLLIQQPVSIQF